MVIDNYNFMYASIRTSKSIAAKDIYQEIFLDFTHRNFSVKQYKEHKVPQAVTALSYTQDSVIQ